MPGGALHLQGQRELLGLSIILCLEGHSLQTELGGNTPGSSSVSFGGRPAVAHSFMHMCLHSFMHMCLHSFIHAYVPSFIHAYVPSFIHS